MEHGDHANRRPPGLLIAVGLVACLGASACGAGGSSPSPGPAGTPAPSATAPVATATPSGPPGASSTPTSVPQTSAVPMDLRIKVVAAASDLTGAPPGSYVFDVAEPMTWPDAGLGCPSPGHSYAPTPIQGWRIVLVVGGTRRLDYHLSGIGEVVLCGDSGG